MSIKKLIAIATLASVCLLSTACGGDAETAAETAAAETSAQGSEGNGTGTEAAPGTETDIYIGDPTDEFVMPEGSEGIVGTWKLGGAEGAASKNTELWVFGADGSYSMIYVDSEGKVVGSDITGAYRIKGDELAVTMMGFTLTYPSYSFEEGNLVIGDRDVVSGEITYMTLEPYTGSITRG